MFIAASFTIAKIWKQCKCTLTYEWKEEALYKEVSVKRWSPFMIMMVFTFQMILPLYAMFIKVLLNFFAISLDQLYAQGDPTSPS